MIQQLILVLFLANLGILIRFRRLKILNVIIIVVVTNILLIIVWFDTYNIGEKIIGMFQ